MELVNQLVGQFLSDTNSDGKVDLNDAAASFKTLLSTGESGLDVAGITSKMSNLGLSDTLSSWLGDGSNLPISADDITKILDPQKLNQFAASMNMDLDSVKSGLSNTIPNLIDKVSSGGALLDKANEFASGDVGELMDNVKKLF